MMTRMMRLLAATALLGATATPALAATYTFTFGTSAAGQFTTAPSSGATEAITSVTGIFMGAAITGIVANPYSPAIAYYYQSTDAVEQTKTYPAGQTGTQYLYDFDNLLLTGNTFDADGLLFKTATSVVNLYSTDTGLAIAYSPIGVNTPPTVITGAATITQTPAAAVPEPTGWALVIAGAGLAGAALRRRPIPARIAFAG